MAMFIFFVGVFVLFVNTGLSFLWCLTGIPLAYPFAPGGALALLTLFTPPLGAVLMLAGGLAYGRKAER